MADENRTLAIIYELIDNVSKPFEQIQEMVSSITQSPAILSIEGNITGAMDALETTATAAQTSVRGVENATQSATKATNQAAEATKKTGLAHSDLANKSTSVWSNMKNQVMGVTDTVGSLQAKVLGFLAAGAIAGVSWESAESSRRISETIYTKLERKGKDVERLKKFVEGKDIDIGSKKERLAIADALMSRTKMSQQAAQDSTEAIEKVWFAQQDYLREQGIGSVKELTNLLTRPQLRGPQVQILQAIGLKVPKTGGTVTQRMRQMVTIGTTIELDKAKADNQLAVLFNRIESFKKAIGKSMVEPMGALIGVVTRVFEAIESIPGAPGLVGMGLLAITAASGIGILITTIKPLAPILTMTKALFIGDTAVKATNIVVTEAATGANLGLATAETAAGTAAKGLWASLALPLAILAALVIIVGIVMYKTGQLQRIMDAFKGSAIGKDVMAGWDALMKAFSGRPSTGWAEGLVGIFTTFTDILITAGGAIDWIYVKGKELVKILSGEKKFKIGIPEIPEPLKKLLKFALLGFMITFALPAIPAILMALLAGKMLKLPVNIPLPKQILDLLKGGKLALSMVFGDVTRIFNLDRLQQTLARHMPVLERIVQVLSRFLDLIHKALQFILEGIKSVANFILSLPGKIVGLLPTWLRTSTKYAGGYTDKIPKGFQIQGPSSESWLNDIFKKFGYSGKGKFLVPYTTAMKEPTFRSKWEQGEIKPTMIREVGPLREPPPKAKERLIREGFASEVSPHFPTEEIKAAFPKIEVPKIETPKVDFNIGVPDWIKNPLKAGANIMRSAPGDEQLLGFQSGGTIFGRGLGKLHEEEEVLTQSKVKVGPGVVSKAIERLDFAMKGGPEPTRSSSQEYHDYNITVPIHIGNISSQVDINKLRKTIRDEVSLAIRARRT